MQQHPCFSFEADFLPLDSLPLCLYLLETLGGKRKRFHAQFEAECFHNMTISVEKKHA